jgi:hypothetical protein
MQKALAGEDCAQSSASAAEQQHQASAQTGQQNGGRFRNYGRGQRDIYSLIRSRISSLMALSSGAYMAKPLAGRAWKWPGVSARSL